MTLTSRSRLLIRFAVLAALAIGIVMLALSSTGSNTVGAQQGTVPDKPTGVVVTATHDSVSLTWEDPADSTITHYQIFRRDRAVHDPGEFVEIDSNTGSATTSYTDANVEPEGSYVYRVKAVNQYGASHWSDFRRADTPAAPTPPPTPTPTPTPTPLTASFEDEAETHNGADSFTFRIEFSEAISINYKTLRDHSLDVTDGSVTGARRVNGSSSLWEITVEPDSGADVTITLPVTTDCGDQGAVCTSDGRKLSNEVKLTVTGPDAPEPTPTPQPNTPATGVPTISGTVRVGQTLEAFTNGISDADGLDDVAYSYQWLADNADIAGATGKTYTLVAADQGTTITVRVTFDDDANNEESLTSVATASVAAASVPADVQEAPAFAERGYVFGLAENTDGSTNRVSLGTVSATDPEGAALSYNIEGGNASGLFEIDATSGELFYTGAGEDFEAGAGPFELTVQASDGDLATHTIVVVTVRDVQEAPAFAEQGYAFDLEENSDGSATRVSLGTVAATDQEGAALSYSIEGGNAAGLFEIGAASGELFYTGAGEDFEAGTGPFELTVRASDGDLSMDTAVTVSVTDVQEAPTPKSVSEPDGEDFSANKSTDGRVAVGDSATGDIGTPRDRDWFAVELVAGGEYRFDLKGSPTGDGTLFDPDLRGVYNNKGRFIRGTTDDDGGTGFNSRETFTPDQDGTYYVAAGSHGIEQGTYTLSVTLVEAPPSVEEPAITIEVADAEATETLDAQILFRVTLDRAPSEPVTVSYATADGTAVAGEDYEATSGTLTFAAGETEQTVAVTIIDDAVEDSGETFRLVLSGPAGAELADAEATGTILNIDESVSEGSTDLPANTSTSGVVALGGSATGQITVGARTTLDTETAGTHTVTVTVTATDPAGGAGDQTVTITVANVNEAPMMTAGLTRVTSHPENTAIDTKVGTSANAYTATDEDTADTALTLSVSGADGGDFDISSAGELTFKEIPNFEMPADANKDNVYMVTVVATDSKKATAMRNVVITVANVDEDGIVTLSSEQPKVGIALTATLTDPDGVVAENVKWTWHASTDGAGDAIAMATSDTYTPEATGELSAKASYTDGHGAGKTAIGYGGAVIENTANVPPEFASATGEREVAEVMDPAEGIGDPVTATDDNEPTNPALTYTLGGADMASFAIVRASGQLQTKAKLDYETKKSYMVTVTATDSDGASASIDVTIKVTNVDEAPMIMAGGLAISGMTSVEYAEDRRDAVATYRASGPDADMAIWSLEGADAGDFSISSAGVLTFVSAPDYETKTTYMVTVKANDGTNEAMKAVTVMVTNVDEDGAVTLSTMSPRVGTELTATLTDADGMVSGTTWQWASSDAMDGTYTDIEDATSDSYTPMEGDEDMYLRATAMYTDGHGSGKSEIAKSANAVSTTPTTGNTEADKYDRNQDGEINREEVLDAIDAYFAEGSQLTKDQVLDIIDLYLGI